VSKIKRIIREILREQQEKQGGAKKKIDIEELETSVIKNVGSFEEYQDLGGYREFYHSYLSLVNEFKLTPVKSNSNTIEKKLNLKRFWWLEPIYNKNRWSPDTIIKLSTVLNIDFYLRNKKYQTEKELIKIEVIYNYMKQFQPKETICREERSLMIFNHLEHLLEGIEAEKYLASREGKLLLKRLQLDENQLGYEVVKEPFIYWENDKVPKHHQQEVLIVEGLATFHTLKKILKRGIAWHLGPIPALLIWGAGRRIEGTISYLEDIVEKPEELTIRYAGDIDYEGFDILYNLKKKNKHLSLHMATEFYRFLCSFGEEYAHTINRDQFRRDELLNFIQNDLKDDPQTFQVIKQLWEKRLRIPQELINIETLAMKGWLSHD
jgi:hypothetical protein